MKKIEYTGPQLSGVFVPWEGTEYEIPHVSQGLDPVELPDKLVDQLLKQPNFREPKSKRTSSLQTQQDGDKA